MLFLPPVAPYRPIYTDQEWPAVLARHEVALKAWEREADIALRIVIFEAVCWFAAVVAVGVLLLLLRAI